jgi:hypothetical protein
MPTYQRGGGEQLCRTAINVRSLRPHSTPSLVVNITHDNVLYHS